MTLTDKDREQRFRTTQFVVEATDCEHQMLWEKFSDEAMKLSEFNKYRWETINPGWIETVGTLDKRPICVSLRWSRINGALILFWYGSSQLVDFTLIRSWVESVCSPRWDGGTRLAHTDAMNFHHVIHHIEEMAGTR